MNLVPRAWTGYAAARVACIITVQQCIDTDTDIYILLLNKYIAVLHCYTLVSVLVLGIGIASGQYYWVLDIGWLSWYRSNPSDHIHIHIHSL